jgi:hypothetical protein
LADAWLLATDPKVAERWHQRVEAVPVGASGGFSGSRAAHDAQVAQPRGVISEAQRELSIREAEAQAAAANRALEKLQEGVA